jgi:hypothetical protein
MATPLVKKKHEKRAPRNLSEPVRRVILPQRDPSLPPKVASF